MTSSTNSGERSKPFARQDNPPSEIRIDSSSDSNSTHAEHVFLFLLALRVLNAITLKTFFQPDEYFQSLEPAWRLAFGEDCGAWITWEWRNQLRSSLHPIFFAGIYQAAAQFSKLCQLTPARRATLLLAAPKVTQAVFAASLDFFTWRFAKKIDASDNSPARTTLALTILSPWQWFCSTRTLSNCIEAALTAAALFFWPWHWTIPLVAHDQLDAHRLRIVLSSISPYSNFGEVARLRCSLLLAALACILRPTNVLIWLPLALQTLLKASSRERQTLFIEAIRCGSLVAVLTSLLDRWYYGVWTFPPLRFLHFNITKSLAVFYGTNRPDYYLTEGLPLLVTTALPFVVVGLFAGFATSFRRSRAPRQNVLVDSVRSNLTWTAVFVIASLSLISHKEARFMYPLLSPLLVLAGRSLANFMRKAALHKYVLMMLLIAVNIGIALYASMMHQRGVIDVMDYLRSEHERSFLGSNSPAQNTTVAFLMPCHSTPWRSHLIYPEIDAWALTCEPPLDIPLDQRHVYLDEADVFYQSPRIWLQSQMEDIEAVISNGRRSREVQAEAASIATQTRDENGFVTGRGRVWPQYLVMFSGLESTVKAFVNGTSYELCWRGFNTHAHDDWRRHGDVVVWCRR